MTATFFPCSGLNGASDAGRPDVDAAVDLQHQHMVIDPGKLQVLGPAVADLDLDQAFGQPDLDRRRRRPFQVGVDYP